MTDDASAQQQPGGRIVQWTVRLLGIMASIFLFAMMWLTFVDVWGRYLFNAPVPGGFEVTELMMATLIFAGLPLVTLSGEHITVDLTEHLFSATFRRYRDVAISIGCTVMMGILSWRMWIKAAEQVDYGDQTAMLNIPVSPVTFFMAAATAFTCILLAILSVASLRRTDTA